MSFPRYPEYKESGVEWLGEVPVHWQICPLKRVTTFNDDVLSEATDGELELKYVEISDVHADRGVTGSTAYLFQDAPSRARRKVRDGDVLVSTVRTYLRAIAPVFSPPDNLVVSTGFAVIRPAHNIVNPGFIGFSLRSQWFVDHIVARSVGVSYPAINATDLVAIHSPIPPIVEQEGIARFLDHETAKIDALIKEQRRLVGLLKEKRQAVISHAVTKGLDPSAPMKDSGVEWLGEVPAHWSVVKLKQAIVFQRGHDLPSDLREPGIVPIVSSGGISGTHNVARAGGPGIVTGRYGSIGEFFLIEEDYWPLNTALFSIDLHQNHHRYLWYLLQSVSEHFTMNSMKSAVPGVDRNDIHEVTVVVAPRIEQQVIIEFLDAELMKLQKLSDQVTEGLHIMKERRSALISAAVTGKIDVRNWQPPADESAFDEEVRQASLEVAL